MKIRVKKPATVGDTQIPAGDYMVTLAAEGNELKLAGGGSTYRVPAVRRKTRQKIKVQGLSYYSGGGGLWNILLSIPPHSEWLGTIKYK